MNRSLLPALLALGLAGCATVVDLPAGFALDARQDEGIAIVSLTLSGKPLDKVSSLEYRLRPAAAPGSQAVAAMPDFDTPKQHAKWVASGRSVGGSDWSAIVKAPNSSEPLDVVAGGKAVGRVALLRLPVGQYEFHSWKLREPAPYGGTEYSPRQGFGIRFAVQPGQVTYVGQLDLDLTADGVQRVTLDDQRARDVALVRRKAPAVAALLP